MKWHQLPVAIFGIFVAVAAGYAAMGIGDAFGLNETISATVAMFAFAGVIAMFGR